MQPDPYRYAIFFSPPPHSPWWDAGNQWLGRACTSAAAQAAWSTDPSHADLLTQLTCEPRRYGWHATIKAPFALALGESHAGLRDGLQAFCDRHAAFSLPPLRVGGLGRFLALLPVYESAQLQELATACVTQLHRYAAPLSSAELERRRGRGALNSAQESLLMKWGYPWVLENFRFHFSLTGDLDGIPDEARQAVLRAAAETFHALPDVHFDRLSLFAEPHKGGDFLLLEQMELRG